jgi:hypothetical protein
MWWCSWSCVYYYILIQIAASKTKIYMVLELVNGGELFDRIVSPRMKLLLFFPSIPSTSRAQDRFLFRCRYFYNRHLIPLLLSLLQLNRPVRENSRSKKQGGSFSSWLMVSAIATKRASIIETSRCQMFLILFPWCHSYQFCDLVFLTGSIVTAWERSCWPKRKHQDLWFWSQCFTATSWGMME